VSLTLVLCCVRVWCYPCKPAIPAVWNSLSCLWNFICFQYKQDEPFFQKNSTSVNLNLKRYRDQVIAELSKQVLLLKKKSRCIFSTEPCTQIINCNLTYLQSGRAGADTSSSLINRGPWVWVPIKRFSKFYGQRNRKKTASTASVAGLNCSRKLTGDLWNRSKTNRSFHIWYLAGVR
jgi:hypothetical protein